MEGDGGLKLTPLLRIARMATALLRLHLDLATREAARERARVASGALIYVAGIAFVTVAIGLGHVAAVVAAHDGGLPWGQAALVVGGGDLAIGGLLLLLGRRRLQGPVMSETRALVRQTITAVTDS